MRIIINGISTYFIVVLFIRTLGKRSTSKMNNFDWIVTVAVGSMLASTVLSKDITITNGLLGIFLLLFLKYVITKIMFYSPTVR